jgi:hypothetical protein
MDKGAGRAHTSSRVDSPVAGHQLLYDSSTHFRGGCGYRRTGWLQREDDGLRTTSKMKREVSLGFKGAIQAVVEFERLQQEAVAVRPSATLPAQEPQHHLAWWLTGCAAHSDEMRRSSGSGRSRRHGCSQNSGRHMP